MMHRLLLVCCSLGVLCGATSVVDKTAATVISAHRNDDPLAVYKALSPVIVRWKPDQLTDLDQQLKSAELPSAADLLGEIRLKLVQQGQAEYLPIPKGKERLLLLRYLHAKIEEFAAQTRTRGEEIRSSKQSRTQEEFGDQLWDLHVLRNDLLTASRIATYSSQLVQDKARNALGTLAEEDKNFIKSIGAGEAFQPLRQTEAQITEFEMQLRFERLKQGIITLRDPSLTKDRFLAAYGTAVDSELLIEYMTSRAEARRKAKQAGEPLPARHVVLDDPDILSDVERYQADAKRLSGDLAAKSRLLMEGLHFWLRGRYGSGSEMGGLLKSELAIRDPKNSMWLFMPRDIRVVPTDPVTTRSNSTPRVPRRFMQTWAWQDRQIQSTIQITSRELDDRVSIKQFW